MEMFHENGKIDRAPSVETCIQWEMKLGLHKLTRPKEAADDWVWIPDHVVSKGVHKCLVVLGVRMNSLVKRGDLTIGFEDVEPLGIVPMRVSNGRLVELEFEEILKNNHGIPPLAIVKDHGSDLLCGGRRFCETHPGVIDVYEIPHKIARLYEHLLKEDESWENFTKKCADFRKQVQLTEYSKLSSPNQRSKARYHNIDVLVDWGLGKLSQYGDFPQDVKEKLKWLQSYSKELEYWGQLVEIGRTGRDFVRKRGLWLDCQEQLKDCLMEKKMCPRAEQFACDLIDFVEEQSNKVPEGKCVIGSSEIVESLFGMHKNIAERGPKPMGRLILSMASRIGEPPTEAIVETAFERIRERDVDSWLRKAFCQR
jgi:hypothetical protein